MRRKPVAPFAPTFAMLLAITLPHPVAADTIRAGIIGCDTSHVIAFTKIFNNPAATGAIADVKIVAAFPGGSDDLPDSYNRLEKFTNQLRDSNVEIVESIADLLDRVDVVLLESVDGRQHLAQARPVIAAGKRLYIDKPLAGTLADAIEVLRLSEERGVPCFSSSALRFCPHVVAMRDNPNVGDVIGCAAFGPCTLEPHHPDLFYYGIHGVEILFAVMGEGCVSVSRTDVEGTDLVVGKWRDGRIGTFRGMRRGKLDYGAMVFGATGIETCRGFTGYEPLIEEIATFFKTGKSPLSNAETIEIFAFMEAADESKRQGGKPVAIEYVLELARQEIARRN